MSRRVIRYQSFASRQSARRREETRLPCLVLGLVLAVCGAALLWLVIQAGMNLPDLYSDADATRLGAAIMGLGLFALATLCGSLACLWAARL